LTSNITGTIWLCGIASIYRGFILFYDKSQISKLHIGLAKKTINFQRERNMKYLGLEIDYSRDQLFDELGLKRLRESYMKDDENSPQERFAFVSRTFGSNLEHSQRLYEYSSKHWLSYATPILSYGRSKYGLPISCFLSWIPDTAKGLVDTLSETNWLSMLGGGVGIGFGIRSAGDKSTGVMPHLKIYDSASLAFKQGTTRRGSYAAYLDISHPDITMFLEMRKPTGDQNMKCLNLHHGINVTDDFMKIIERCMIDKDADDSWELKEPNSEIVKEVVSAKLLWQKIIEMRIQTGEPYLHFIDTSNRALPEYFKEAGLKIRQSNLCIEIMEPTSEERTAVCCLSSLNLDKYDEWKENPLFVRDCLEMLDNVLEFFVNKAPPEISRAKLSAMRERNVGIGVLGFHAYLQSKGIPFESAIAKGRNKVIFKDLREKIDKANLELGKERGEAPDAKGSGKRLGLTSAIAPNACVTGDTKILLSDNSSISFYDLGQRMDVDMESFENISIDLEDGQTIELHLGAPLLVDRHGQQIEIIAAELIEDDEILKLLGNKNES
jgi:ribonucleoside-diphosphate reductase alpha chain